MYIYGSSTYKSNYIPFKRVNSTVYVGVVTGKNQEYDNLIPRNNCGP